jgi:hypothetical protein
LRTAIDSTFINNGFKLEPLRFGFQNYQQQFWFKTAFDIFEPINISPPRVISLFILKLFKSPQRTLYSTAVDAARAGLLLRRCRRSTACAR